MNLDMVTMIGNISQSMIPVQRLVTGLAYLLGTVFFIKGLGKLKKIGGASPTSGSQEKMIGPLAYFLGGATLFFTPTALGVFSNTFFGTGTSIMGYKPYNALDIVATMGVMVQAAGAIWFVRGCVLLVNASEPGVQHGAKGFAFLIAGVLAVNFHMTLTAANTIVTNIVNYTMGTKPT